jgi:hypothetical protein
VLTFYSCYKSGDFSDLIITCGPDTTLSTRSSCASVQISLYERSGSVAKCVPDFCSLRSDADTAKEATESKIDLPDDEPAIVKLLVEYLYEGEYEPRLNDSPTSEITTETDMSRLVIVKTDLHNTTYNRDYTYKFPHSCRHDPWSGSLCGVNCICPHHVCNEACRCTCNDFVCTKCTRPIINGPADQLLTHAKMYEIADKYDVVDLKELAQTKFEVACAAYWNDDLFAVAAHHAFSTTMAHDKGLRDIVSGTICDHMELIHKPAIETLMTEFNGLSFGILKKKADEHGWGKKN